MSKSNLGKLTAGLLAAALMGACNKSAEEQQREALEARNEADKKAERANEKAETEINTARQEADKKTAEAQRDALKKQQEAITSRDETVQDAQKDADQATQEATSALRKSGTGLRLALEKQLDDIDARSKRVQEKLGDKIPDDARSNITDIQKRSNAARDQLRAFETNTVASLDTFRAQLSETLRELQKSVRKLEDKI